MKKKFILISEILLIFIITSIIIYFLKSAIAVGPTASITPTSINEDTKTLVNFTITNTHENTNITNITITFPSNITIFNDTFIQGNNGSSRPGTFSNGSNYVRWINDTILINGSSTGFFWVNISMDTPGNYNMTINVGFNRSVTNVSNETGVSLVVNDTTAPNITLISPTNTSNYSDSDNVSFIFNVIDSSDIANCSLIINSTAYVTNTSAISKGVNQTLGTVLNLNARYNWYINCTDNSSNRGTSAALQTMTNSSNLTNCNYLTSNGSYYIINNITNLTATQCINISSSDVSLDCQAYMINGTTSGNRFGIFVRNISTSKLTNVNIKNCTVTNWGGGGITSAGGIQYFNVENGTIISNNISNNAPTAKGIIINGSSHIIIKNNSINANGNDNIFLHDSSDNILSNNNLTLGQIAIQLDNSSNNIISNNNVSFNSYSFGVIVFQGSSSNNILINNEVDQNKSLLTSWGYYNYNNSIINQTIRSTANDSLNISDSSLTIKNSYLERYAFWNTTIIIENTSNGKVQFLNITQNGTNLSNDIQIWNNSIVVNSSQSGLNVRANLTIYSLNVTSPQILKDGVVCTDCSQLQFNITNGTIIFTVTSFSNYSIRQTPASSPGGGSSGGGGGGGGSSSSGTTYLVGRIEEKGTTGTSINGIQANDSIKFNLTEQEHKISTKKITNDSINLEITSVLFNVTLSANEEKKFNLTNASYYDLLIKINGVANNKVNLTIKAILEGIPVAKPAGTTTNETEAGTTSSLGKTEQPKEKSKLWIWIASGIIAIIIFFMLIKTIKTKKK